jgi:hypothetical protein
MNPDSPSPREGPGGAHAHAPEGQTPSIETIRHGGTTTIVYSYSREDRPPRRGKGDILKS